MARRERYLVGLDVGTSKVAAIVGEAMDEGGLDIIGIGLAESKGIRRGVVNNVDSAAEAIKKAIDEAGPTAKRSTAAVSSPSPAATAKSPAMTSSGRLTPLGRLPFPAAARSSTCSP